MDIQVVIELKKNYEKEKASHMIWIEKCNASIKVCQEIIDMESKNIEAPKE
jgi:hypothetical protein